MRTLLSITVLGALAVCGCAGKKASPPPPAAAPVASTGLAQTNRSGSKPIITSENALIGKVVGFYPEGRFVVLNFPVGRLPTLNQSLSVYRLGLKVGELKVGGPQRDDNIVADLVAGEAQVGDEVRDR
jgi:hypothetical protein